MHPHAKIAIFVWRLYGKIKNQKKNQNPTLNPNKKSTPCSSSSPPLSPRSPVTDPASPRWAETDMLCRHHCSRCDRRIRHHRSRCRHRTRRCSRRTHRCRRPSRGCRCRRGGEGEGGVWEDETGWRDPHLFSWSVARDDGGGGAIFVCRLLNMPAREIRLIFVCGPVKWPAHKNWFTCAGDCPVPIPHFSVRFHLRSAKKHKGLASRKIFPVVVCCSRPRPF